MKKIILLALLLVPMVAKSQNLQLHYDLGRNQYSEKPNYSWFTTTFEMFKPDSLGSTFWFIDLDYQTNKSSIQSAYLEIARDFNISKKSPFQLHLEYNGGLFSGGGINHIWLVGINYPFMIGNSAFNTYITYNHISGNTEGADFQWTGVWNVPLCNNKFMFSGFVDIWSTDKVSYDLLGNELRKGKRMIFLSEPQIWYNINKSFSVGGEVEISQNFIFNSDKVEAYPTIAVKWNF